MIIRSISIDGCETGAIIELDDQFRMRVTLKSGAGSIENPPSSMKGAMISASDIVRSVDGSGADFSRTKSFLAFILYGFGQMAVTQRKRMKAGKETGYEAF